jgi:hypothetical protein
MATTLFLYLLSLICWLGGMIFFAFFVAPVIFTRLPVADAGKVVAGIFPRYYLLGYVAGVIAVVLAIYFAITAEWARGWWSAAALMLAIALALTFYAGLVIRPQVDQLRTVAEETNPDPARKERFDKLHRASVQLNGAVMVLNLLALISTAAALGRRG